MKNNVKKHKKSKDSATYKRQYYDLYPKKESDDLTKIIAIQIANEAGPFKEGLVKAILENDYLYFISHNISYNDYTPHSCRYIAAVRQVCALYSKDNDLHISGVSPRENCLKSFIETEQKCRVTNQRLFTLLQSEHDMFSAYPFLEAILRKVTEIVGDAPELCDATFSYGPGSSVNVSKKYSSPLNKLNAGLQCSSRMLSDLGLDYICNFPHLLDQHADQIDVVCARFDMVPKNALTLRTTVTEPGLNMPGQKFLGQTLRARLFDYGLDLSVGQEVNQALALLGSINDEIVTVDAKNASNTISIFAIYLALYFSKDWFDVLNSFRSPLFDIEGVSKPYSTEMFSSMGNGFTFELETVVFYAISLVATQMAGGDTSMVKVYGDDMIVPSEAYPYLREYLEFFGFEVNVDKTYTSGPFRESCGKDYFFGTDIRPFYKKDRWTDARLIGFLNRDGAHLHLLSQSFRNYLINTIRSDFAIGPLGIGDGHLVPYYENEIKTRFYKRIHRSVRQRMKNGDAHGFVFETTITRPLTSLTDKQKRDAALENNLYPLYDIYNRPEHRKIYDKRIMTNDETFDRNGDIDIMSFSLSPVYSIGRESDPYTLPGGWRAEKVYVYFVNFPDFPLELGIDFTSRRHMFCIN